MNKKIPTRIVSLVPSKTELLYYLGLDEEVVGITKFCIHPARWFKSKTRVGGTKQLHLDKIRELKPDLIIANKEENTQADIETLSKEFEVYVSDIKTIPDALTMITEVGILAGKKMEADDLVKKISIDFQLLVPVVKRKRALYFIWQKPYMVAGADTFIHSMMNVAGFENAMSAMRYPTLEEGDIKAINPEILLLSSEPFPFKEKHIESFQAICPSAQVILVDGELFSWYGSRMLEATNYFKSLYEELRD
jgi:ABC-type Fe3+-hydroxamate transport system substrate-binding protein